jgi:outer membrane protein
MIYQLNFYNITKKLFKAVSAVLLISLSSTAQAITLDDAIISAYENNYSLKAEAENYSTAKTLRPKALAGFLPSASFTHQRVKQKYDTPTAQDFFGDSAHQQILSFNQPIFNGGRTVSEFLKANSQVEGGFQNFRDVMNTVAFQTAQAYENVLASEEIYKINVDNESRFKKYLDYTQTRFESGVVTRTDVLQAQVRLAESTSSKERAHSDFVKAQATLERLIGFSPDSKTLEPVKIDYLALPKSVDEVREAAFDSNPILKASKATEQVALYDLGIATSVILPTVSANVQQFRSNSSRNFSSSNDSTTYNMRLEVPIFQGGAEYADIGARVFQKYKAEYDSLETERRLEENIISSWNTYITNKYTLQFRTEAVRAAKSALEGVHEEVNIGTKTTIDLLDAETDLFNTLVSERITKRDLIVSAYQILQLVGRLDIL